MFPIIKNRKIRIAVIGCGRISKNHFGAIQEHTEDMELCAVCDTDPETLKAHQETHQVPGYARMQDLLTEEKPDLVALCSPSGLHPEQTILAARHGVNVMTEKPMATRWQDGVRMVKACDEAGVYLFVVKQNRRNATLQLLKRAVMEKRFGRIHMVHLNVFWARPQSYYDQHKWRGTWEFDGGAFMNQASHYVDLLDWLIGPVDKVQAMVSTTRDIEVEDTGVLNVRWRNGALGSMSVTMLTYPKNLEGSITILGEKGSVRVGGVAVNDIQLWDFDEPRDYDEQIKNANYETTSVYGFGHPLYYKNVIDSLRGDAKPETDGREGLKSLEVLIAAYLSARDGKTVSLPLEY
ncbi:Gfo/Idh/MocA family protein [Ectothiorhodospira variabilis]|uniref:Gfo/Idh/MocA family protein n=1 Tax=Ectothiorhodospira variabilis TaxID=505694 RepID=UPI001EFBB52D|nr:Gfo/Idh/MocA family oxidoreductase [Ectothiorhodospira variabilis]MCG5495448.1 Gfo/Idh/MocA family oxidoreductase [Ectothiorhodospira variabilis]MCG5505046.1 Gfo/Idh/MocA family oxidoreductase [Ectothiorhodospira variabilis]MCG5508203.1 Gfo/Idh/MocA family oxidoreductase [Ectothiorhodospira variabilis]